MIAGMSNNIAFNGRIVVPYSAIDGIEKMSLLNDVELYVERILTHNPNASITTSAGKDVFKRSTDKGAIICEKGQKTFDVPDEYDESLIEKLKNFALPFFREER